jgi:ABC-type phosphate transport system substrate-binding protein
MKLSDLFNSFNRKFSEVSNFTRYPKENISRILIRWGQNLYENAEVPGNRQQENSSDRSESTTRFPEKIEHTEKYNGYISNGNGNGKHPAEYHNGFNQTVVQTLPRQSIKQPAPLKPNTEIRGRRGRYQIENIILDKESKGVRLYRGLHFVSNNQVWIKEYLLPESDFNQQEARKTKDEFEELTTFNFKGEEGKDFRLITPWDAIVTVGDERRCYLITELVNNRCTLREYLEKTQIPMTSKQVRKVLELVLVSLKYLHEDSKIYLPKNQRPHGNLSLDSLLISTDKLDDNTESEQFFIYLSDFAIWENLFKQPNLKLNHPSIQKDLQDLGTIAFYLLHGRDKDPVFGNFLDPKNEKHWVNINDVNLKNFIRRLLGLDTPFENAEEARIFLLKPQPQLPNTIEEVIEPEEDESELNDDSKKLPILFIVIISGLLLGLIGFFVARRISIPNSDSSASSEEDVNKCCINTIEVAEELNKKLITYNVPTSETTLKYLMMTKNLVSASKTFPEELNNRVQSLQLKYDKSVKTIPDAIAKVKNNKTQFFITQYSDEELKNIPNANQLKTETVAYEGIVVFVAFSDSKRDNSFPKALNGKISFDDLQQLYNGEKTTWKDFNAKLPDLPVKLYIPQDTVVINKFKQLIFKDNEDGKQRFENLIEEGKIKKENTQKTLSNIFNEFENKDKSGIGIGFGLLSKVYNQCGVYPLSIGEKGKEVQVLIQNNGKDSKDIQPDTNLCKKGGYHPNPKVMNKKEDGYPLKFPISVVYPEDEEKSLAGEKFVEILTTDEGQTLLKEAGLVPIRKLNDN